MIKNDDTLKNDGRRSNILSYESVGENALSTSIGNDPFIGDIYVHIGAIAVLLLVLASIITAIKNCRKLCNQDQHVQQISQSSTSLTRLSSIRRSSSLRNMYVPIHRSSIDVRFQMESRERRQSQSILIKP